MLKQRFEFCVYQFSNAAIRLEQGFLMRRVLLLAIPYLFLYPLSSCPAAELNDEGPVILAIFNHADDEVIVAPLLAKYARQGARVHLVIATDGRFGVPEHAGVAAGDELASVRKQEARCSAEALGISPPHFLEFENGFSFRFGNIREALGLLARLRKEILNLFQEMRPDVVITWGPDGGYGNPDHRILGAVVSEVFQERAHAWPQHLLFPGVSTARGDHGLKFESVMMRAISVSWRRVNDDFLDVRVPYTDADRRSTRAAIGCYASQFDPDEFDNVGRLIEHFYDGEVTLRSWGHDGKSVSSALGAEGSATD